MKDLPPLASLMTALQFAAEKHRTQRRKDSAASPYVNHVIEVAYLLATVGGVTDIELLQAAILHDAVEDTDASPEEIEQQFGAAVRSLVMEVRNARKITSLDCTGIVF
jgi:(p)ppGpp synthase/HD superfamily hydrolase